MSTTVEIILKKKMLEVNKHFLFSNMVNCPSILDNPNTPVSTSLKQKTLSQKFGCSTNLTFLRKSNKLKVMCSGRRRLVHTNKRSHTTTCKHNTKHHQSTSQRLRDHDRCFQSQITFVWIFLKVVKKKKDPLCPTVTGVSTNHSKGVITVDIIWLAWDVSLKTTIFVSLLIADVILQL